jgi:hypothetical protein
MDWLHFSLFTLLLVSVGVLFYMNTMQNRVNNALTTFTKIASLAFAEMKKELDALKEKLENKQ